MATKYQPLVDYLVAQSERAMTLSYAEIEAIIGLPLNAAMRTNVQMWNGAHQAYVRAWEAAGWLATIDRPNRCVHFARDSEGRAG